MSNRRSDELNHSKAAMANDVYEMEKAEAVAKGQSSRITRRIIEMRFGLKRYTLDDWRANNLCRKGLTLRNGTLPGTPDLTAADADRKYTR